MGSYIPSTQAEREEMLRTMGMSSADELYRDVPSEVLLSELNIPQGMTEMQAAAYISGLADKNTRFSSIFRGAGAYDHYIPSIVKSITSKEEFVTAYTPYQAEISQGVLQSIFEYQTQMCELTGMDVSNASVYDGATAAAEAVFMCEERKKSGVIVSDAVNPQVITVMKTYLESRGVSLTLVPSTDGVTSPSAIAQALFEAPATACVYVQYPNFYGNIEDYSAIAQAAHAAGAKLIMGTNPIALGMLKTPAEYGADIAVGEGQPLGLPIAFGGPYLGFMTCKKDMMRKLPGRIVGQTVDAEGKRCFVLTLQAREQHIRREKASSNICSNEALCAMTASVYLSAMGPGGLKAAAENSAAHAHYLAGQLSLIPGFEVINTAPYFHEFVTTCPMDADILMEKLAENGILGGLPVDGGILWCCTEKNTKTDIDRLVNIIKEVSAS